MTDRQITSAAARFVPELGEITDELQQGKKTYFIHEFGITKFTNAIEPSRCKLEIVVGRLPQKIMNLKQAKYILQRRSKWLNPTKF